MLGLRNLYRAFEESRATARKRLTLAVTGDPPHAGDLARLLAAEGGADKNLARADVLLTAIRGGSGGVEVSVSGGAVEDDETFPLPAVTGETVSGELASRLAGVLEEDYLVSMGRGYPVLRRAVCKEVIRKNARQNAVIGLLPIPGADMPTITANQARMVLGIAAVHGEEISPQRARELGGVLAAGFGFRTLSRQILKLVPLGGWAASAAIGYAGTLAMGRTAILYFERGGTEPTPDEVSGIRERAKGEAKAFLARIRKKSR